MTGRWRPGWVALVVSVAVHAVLVAWLSTRKPLAFSIPRFKKPVEIEVVHLTSVPETKPAPVPKVAPAKPPVVVSKPRAPLARVEAPPSPPVATPSVPGPRAPAGSPSPAEPSSDLPRAPKLSLELAPRTFEGGPIATPAAPRGPPVTSEAPKARTPTELIAEGQGKRRVENGLVDPYFAQLGKALIDNWKAEEHVTTRGLKGWMNQVSENQRIYNSMWRENAKRYAVAGSPFSSEAPLPTVVDRTGGTQAAAARDAYARQLKEQYTARKRALLRVVQNRDGVLREVTLVEGSDEPALDREAVADVRAAASRMPPPPQDGLGIKEPIVSLWEFQLSISISPPIPTMVFEFDEALRFLDVRLPLDRRIYKRVKLVSVE